MKKNQTKTKHKNKTRDVIESELNHFVSLITPSLVIARRYFKPLFAHKRFLWRRESAPRRPWKWSVKYQIGFESCTGEVRTPTRTVEEVIKYVGARPGTLWDGSKYSGVRTGIDRTKPSRPTALARCSMRVNDLRLPGSLLFILYQIVSFFLWRDEKHSHIVRT